MRCRPTGTAKAPSAGSPSSWTLTPAGSPLRVTRAAVSVATVMVDAGNAASPARWTSTVMPATPVSRNVRYGSGPTGGPTRQSNSL